MLVSPAFSLTFSYPRARQLGNQESVDDEGREMAVQVQESVGQLSTLDCTLRCAGHCALGTSAVQQARWLCRDSDSTSVLPFPPTAHLPFVLQSPSREAPQCCPRGGQPRQETDPHQPEHSPEQRTGEAQNCHVWQHSVCGSSISAWPSCGHQETEGKAQQGVRRPLREQVVRRAEQLAMPQF